MLRTHRAGKGEAWGNGVWGLGSMQQKGPRRASDLGGWGTWPGSPAGFPGLCGWGKCPLLWSWRAPPACLSCSPLASLLCPQDQHGHEGALEGRRTGVLPGPECRANALHSSPAPLVLEGSPPAIHLSSSSPPPFYTLRTNTAQRGPLRV